MTERDRDGVRPTDPYSKLLEERIVLVGTPLDDACVSDVITQLIHLEYTAPDRPISLYINSPGGSFTAMTALYDAINFVSCEIETVCLGQAVSVAAVVLAAGAPGRRLALPGARIVLRQPARAEALQGQPDDLAIFARELSRARETLELLLARHTGQQRDQVSQDVERDTVLDAAGAVGYGLIDQIAGPRQRYGRLGLKG